MRQSHPNCNYGFHWVWTRASIRGGMCVSDYQYQCAYYIFNLGICRNCNWGYRPIFTSYSNRACVPFGVEEAEVSILRTADDDQMIIRRSPVYRRPMFGRPVYRRPMFGRPIYRRPYYGRGYYGSRTIYYGGSLPWWGYVIIVVFIAICICACGANKRRRSRMNAANYNSGGVVIVDDGMMGGGYMNDPMMGGVIVDDGMMGGVIVDDGMMGGGFMDDGMMGGGVIDDGYGGGDFGGGFDGGDFGGGGDAFDQGY